jgi:hypothetical protein
MADSYETLLHSRETRRFSDLCVAMGRTLIMELFRDGKVPAVSAALTVDHFLGLEGVVAIEAVKDGAPFFALWRDQERIIRTNEAARLPAALTNETARTVSEHLLGSGPGQTGLRLTLYYSSAALKQEIARVRGQYLPNQ